MICYAGLGSCRNYSSLWRLGELLRQVGCCGKCRQGLDVGHYPADNTAVEDADPLCSFAQGLSCSWSKRHFVPDWLL